MTIDYNRWSCFGLPGHRKQRHHGGTMSVDLDRLEQLARAATPIDWTFEGPTKDAFIHAANPPVVLELAQRLRAAEAIVRDLARHNPVSWASERLPAAMRRTGAGESH
jgi:hypothetical protein